MPLFRYEAINPAGQKISGTHTADILSQVETWLAQKGLTPVRIEIAAETDLAPTGAARYLKDLRLAITDRFIGVTIEDLILFCRQLSTMLSAGIAVLPALEIIVRQMDNPRFKKIALAVADDIESGVTMSDSFAVFPRTFNKLFLNIVRIGEETGSLNSSFEYLADLYENEKDIKERINAATRYPKLVLIAILGAVTFLMTFVVPKFVGLFSKSSATLPLPTRLLIAISDFFSHNLLLLGIGVVLLATAWRLAMQYDGVVLAWDRWLLRVPILGELSVKIYMSRFCRVLAVLSKSGIDIITGLRLSASALENLVLFRMAEDVLGEVEEGVPLNTAMAKHPLFPPLVVQMVAVGEETGEVDQMLNKVADYYDKETNYTIKNPATLIEPLLLLVMGTMVGFIALAIFMPMWDMMNVMRG